MKLLSIQNIDPELASPGFWTQKKLVFLTVIMDVCPNRAIRKSDLTKITSGIKDRMNSIFYFEGPDGKQVPYAFTKKEKIECNDVFEVLQNHNWIVSFFQLEKKDYRPSVMPMTDIPFQCIDAYQCFREEFWLGIHDVDSNIKMMLLIEIVLGTGLSTDKIINAHRSGFLLDSPKGYLKIALANGSSKTALIPLSAKATLLIEYVKYHQIDLDFNRLTPEEEISKISITPYFNGIESVIYAQMKRKQLPVPLPDRDDNHPVVFRYRKDEYKQANTNTDQQKLIWRSRISNKDARHIESLYLFKGWNTSSLISSLPDLDYGAVELEETLNWSKECLITINAIRYQLKKLLTDEKGNYQNGRLNPDNVYDITNQAVWKTIERAKQRAELNASALNKKELEESIQYLRLTLPHLALRLAIDRIEYHLCQCGNTLDTCLKEIHYLFERGLLLLHPTLDLRSWDDEDIELVLSDCILERENYTLSTQTIEEIVKSFRRVIRYARRSFGLFTRVELPDIQRNSIVITSRNHVLGPTEFDRIKIKNNPTLILAFYAGMRAGEIANLTMKDIVANHHAVTIYIRKGKTPSARRSIPLHLIAPPEAVKTVIDYYETRKTYYRAYVKKTKRAKEAFNVLSKASFLSLRNDHFDRSGAIGCVRQAFIILQTQIGPGASLHLLRHSFASMMFLRWYCAKYPDLVTNLVDHKHWCFSKNGLSTLNTFFGEQPELPLPETNITAILHLIKLMGHKNTDTFFQVYVHSFYTVLEHALKRVNAKDDHEELKGKIIAQLIPGMRSRTSQAKLKSRKAIDLIHLFP